MEAEGEVEEAIKAEEQKDQNTKKGSHVDLIPF
jgi:hypothetical protein